MRGAVMPREPYGGTSGAYCTPPQLQRGNDGRWHAHGEIQQWTGSLADIYAATEIVLDGHRERSAAVSIALNSGISQRYEAPFELRMLAQLDPDAIATVRVDADIPDGCAVILVRRQKPGVIVTIAGRERANVLGLAQLVHGRLMTGYEDIGSPRGFLARAKSKGALFVTAPQDGHDPEPHPHAQVAIERAVPTPSPACADDPVSPASSEESVRSATAPTAVVLWAHGSADWRAAEEEAWKKTVLAFTELLRAGGIEADLDLFHGHSPTDWSRFGPKAIRTSDYVLVAVSSAWRRAWDDEIEPGKSAGAVGEANALRGLFKENRQKFLQRVIPVLLPGREESDLPTDLKATSHWERVPTLDEQGIEDLYRRITGQPAHPKPPLGKPRKLPPRTLFTTEDASDSQQEIEHQIERADSALARMPRASSGPGEEPWDQARQSVQARRQALRRELAQLEGAQEQRLVLDDAARCLAKTEASAREAWRVLLDLDIRSDSQLDDILRTEHFDFPQTRSAVAEEAVQSFSQRLEQLREIAARLVLCLDDTEPALQAFFAARDHLAAVATTMVFAARGVIGVGGDDPELTIEEFFAGCHAQRAFYREARHILT